MKLLTLKLNVPLLGFKAGREIKVKTNKGIPLDRFWRARLEDAKIDECVEVVKAKSKPQKPKENEENK